MGGRMSGGVAAGGLPGVRELRAAPRDGAGARCPQQSIASLGDHFRQVAQDRTESGRNEAMKRIVILMLGSAAVALGWQSSLKLDHLDRLTAKATDSVNITLDASMLKLAAAFLSSDDDD